MLLKKNYAKMLLSLLLCAQLSAIATTPQNNSEETDCPQITPCEKTITWKNVLLYSSVCIVGLVTFSLVAVNNNK